MVSIKEVAKHAGVAISTVSKVLNGYPNVSEETKKKVQDAIKELNYIPNSIAAALSSKQFGRIALVLDPNRQTQAIDQVFMQYLVGALDKAKELNVEVVTIFPSMIAGMTAEEITRSFLSQSISGVVIYGMSKEDKVLQKLIREKQFACVVVDARLSIPGLHPSALIRNRPSMMWRRRPCWMTTVNECSTLRAEETVMSRIRD